MKIAGFDWDQGNRDKSTKHGLSTDEIEDFFSRKLHIAPDLKHSDLEDRFLAIGLNWNQRPMVVAFTFRERDRLKFIRPISARYMHKKEVKKYEEAFEKNKI